MSFYTEAKNNLERGDMVATISEAREYFDRVIPNIVIQQSLFSRLLPSIDECKKVSEAWSVSFLRNGFRLNVGNVEAFAVFFGRS